MAAQSPSQRLCHCAAQSSLLYSRNENSDTHVNLQRSAWYNRETRADYNPDNSQLLHRWEDRLDQMDCSEFRIQAFIQWANVTQVLVNFRFKTVNSDQ